MKRAVRGGPESSVFGKTNGIELYGFPALARLIDYAHNLSPR
jgi:hypothetical protein